MSTYIGNNDISGIYIGSSAITAIYVGTDVIYTSGDNTKYLSFTSQQDNSSVSLNTVGTPSAITLEYSTDKQTWNTWDLSTITINSGDTVYLRGNNSSNFSISTSNYYKFVMSGSIAASGSIMTLMDKTNVLRVIPNNYCFTNLFSGCTSLTTAPVLPATTLTSGCYRGMFQGTAITTAPALPATTLASNCYNDIFKNCTSLVNPPSILPATTLANNCYRGMFQGTAITIAPELPATTLANNCYDRMFSGATSLTIAPELPSKSLVSQCYQYMFSGATSLNTVTVYADDISANNCTRDWLNGVAATGTFYNGGNAVYTSGASGIPTGWTEVDIKYNYLCFLSEANGSTIELTKVGSPDAITLEYSLDKLTWNTWDLSTITLNSGDKMYLRGDNATFSSSDSNYYKFVMSGSIAASGSIMTLMDKTDTLRTVTDRCFNKLFSQCTALTVAPELPATTLGVHSYDCTFEYCSNLAVAPSILPATALTEYCYSGMFRYTNIMKAPVLPATTLVSLCYNEMFRYCSQLNEVTSYANTIGSLSLNNWLNGVAGSGTFYNYGGATYPSGNSGIPSGWTEVTQ